MQIRKSRNYGTENTQKPRGFIFAAVLTTGLVLLPSCKKQSEETSFSNNKYLSIETPVGELTSKCLKQCIVRPGDDLFNVITNVEEHVMVSVMAGEIWHDGMEAVMQILPDKTVARVIKVPFGETMPDTEELGIVVKANKGNDKGTALVSVIREYAPDIR